MSCYFRHLKDVFDEAGITVTPANREKIDQAIQKIVGTTGQPCPETWRSLKKQLADSSSARQLISQLKSVL
jgi:hypothetical protein